MRMSVASTRSGLVAIRKGCYILDGIQDLELALQESHAHTDLYHCSPHLAIPQPSWPSPVPMWKHSPAVPARSSKEVEFNIRENTKGMTTNTVVVNFSPPRGLTDKSCRGLLRKSFCWNNFLAGVKLRGATKGHNHGKRRFSENDW